MLHGVAFLKKLIFTQEIRSIFSVCPQENSG
jgi:hypothetical protein